MSVEAIISRIAAGTIEEREGYTGKKATIIIGDKITHIYADGVVCKVNGEPVEDYYPPRKADKIVLSD